MRRTEIAILGAIESRAAKLPVPGMHNLWIIDSAGALALEELPDSTLVIGVGVIGLEWTLMFVDLVAP